LGIPVTSAFHIEIVNRDGGLVVRVEGELDVATAAVLDERLREVESTELGLITIDLAGVSFIDSTGLRALVEAHVRDCAGEHPAGGRLRITGGSEQAQKLFELAGVLDKLPFVASADG
jgi:anti-sigma B factor antagonist